MLSPTQFTKTQTLSLPIDAGPTFKSLLRQALFMYLINQNKMYMSLEYIKTVS